MLTTYDEISLFMRYTHPHSGKLYHPDPDRVKYFPLSPDEVFPEDYYRPVENFCFPSTDGDTYTCPACGKTVIDKEWQFCKNEPDLGYCPHCDKPFPWLIEKVRIALDYIEADKKLTAEGKSILEFILPDMFVETPDTKKAKEVFQKFYDNGFCKTRYYNLYFFLIFHSCKAARSGFQV